MGKGLSTPFAARAGSGESNTFSVNRVFQRWVIRLPCSGRARERGEKGASHQIWAHYGDDSVGEQQLFRDDVSAQRQRQLVHPRHLPGAVSRLQSRSEKGASHQIWARKLAAVLAAIPISHSSFMPGLSRSAVPSPPRAKRRSAVPG